MRLSAENRLFAIWALLVGITILSWWLGHRRGAGSYHLDLWVTAGVLLMAAVKIRIIIRQFMEVAHAPNALRRLTDGWIALVMVALLGIYVFGIGLGR